MNPRPAFPSLHVGNCVALCIPRIRVTDACATRVAQRHTPFEINRFKRCVTRSRAHPAHEFTAPRDFTRNNSRVIFPTGCNSLIVPALARFRGNPTKAFVTVMGLIAISAILYGLT